MKQDRSTAPSRLVRLGYQHPDDDGLLAVTIGDRIGGVKRGFRLSPSDAEVWRSLDGTRSSSELSPYDQAHLQTLLHAQLACLIGGPLNEASFEVIPVQRRQLKVVEVTDEGYEIEVDGGAAFDLDEWPARFITHVDGKKTLTEIAYNVLGVGRQNPADAKKMDEWEKQSGRCFEEYLAEAAMQFITRTLSAGAHSFEPGDHIAGSDNEISAALRVAHDEARSVWNRQMVVLGLPGGGKTLLSLPEHTPAQPAGTGTEG